MEHFDLNPFDRTALTDSKLLAARANELRKIRFILRTSSKQLNRFRSIIISGNRGVGKTSFLNLIESDCKAYNLIPIRLNLTTLNTENPNEFFWYLFNQTISIIFDMGLFGGKSGEIDIAIQKIVNCEKSEDPAMWVFKTPIIHRNYLSNNKSVFEFDQLIKDIELIKKEINESDNEQFNEKTKLLFLVDEAHLIYVKKEIIESIRFIVQHNNLGIGFVFAGDESYESSEWENIFGGSQRDFEIIKLNYFNDVDDVVDFFKKSLESIGWSTKDIEETYFYRLKHTCLQIFLLTSGRPEWINFIAKKMFDRCTEGESNILKFDKQTQTEIKQILESSGKLNNSQLSFIENLSPKFYKWLSKIFASEFSTLNNVYFYAKFNLVEENFIDLEEYKKFCKQLIDLDIILFLNPSHNLSKIGFVPPSKEINIIDVPYITFGRDNDTIKHWLQINSNGKLQFGFYRPSFKFMESINNDLVLENKNNMMLFSGVSNENEEPNFRFSEMVRKINNNNAEIINEPYDNIYYFYKACKRIANSEVREVLYVELKNLTSKNDRYWNIINFDENDHIIGFYNNPKRVERIKSNIESYNSPESQFSFELHIDVTDKPNIENFQKLIIKSGDKKKLGIITQDKMEDLVRYYVNGKDKDAAKKDAIFFYQLFEEGYDLRINELNNSAYVFLNNDELEKSNLLLGEGRRKIRNEEFEKEELDSTCILLYNSAMLEIKMSNYSRALNAFKVVINYVKETENIDDSGIIVLNILDFDEKENNIVIKEIGEKDEQFPLISCSKFSQHNIEIIERFLAVRQLS